MELCRLVRLSFAEQVDMIRRDDVIKNRRGKEAKRKVAGRGGSRSMVKSPTAIHSPYNKGKHMESIY